MIHLSKRLILDSRKPMLLTFDAFNTLYKPRAPIGSIYAEYGRKHGLTGFTDSAIHERFKHAFKNMSHSYPLYGRGHALMSPQEWWNKVVQLTFQSSMLRDVSALSDELWRVFSTSSAYCVRSGALRLFETINHLKIKHRKGLQPFEISTGVITNSDPRVPSVLSSLGFRVNAGRGSSSKSVSDSVKGLRTAADASCSSPVGEDINFVVTSYDIGAEKPEKCIFDAALKFNGYCPKDNPLSSGALQAIHVGDDMCEDYEGALKAGWQALLVGGKGEESQGTISISSLEELDEFLQQLGCIV